MSKRDEELEKLFHEVHALTDAVALNVHVAAQTLDKLVLSPEFVSEFPRGLFSSPLASAGHLPVRSERRAIVRAFPNYRAYLDRVSPAYPLFTFRALIGYVRQRLIEIEAALILLLEEDD